MKYNAFVNSLKVQTYNFRNEVIRTSNEYTNLEQRYKELQKNLTTVFRSMSQEKDDIIMTERRIRRESDRARINGRPQSQKRSYQESFDNQARPKSELVRTRGFDLNDTYNRMNYPNKEFKNIGNDRRRIVQAPCHVMTFEKERYTPFTAHANSTQINIKRSFPTPKCFRVTDEKKRSKENQESKEKPKLPRVAYLSTTSPF